MSYGSDEDENTDENDSNTANRKNNDNKSNNKNTTEIETLTKFIERPKSYFTDPIINFAELKNEKNLRSSFLQIDNLIINDIKQWKLLISENLEEINSQINKIILNNLSPKNSEKKENQKTEISKNFKINKNIEFDSVLIEANFRFKNIFWNNSTAYIIINDEIYWMEHHNWENNIKCNMDNWNSPIRIILKKNDLLKEENKENNFNFEMKFGVKPDINLMKLKEINEKMANCPLKDFDFEKKSIAEFVDMRISLK